MVNTVGEPLAHDRAVFAISVAAELTGVSPQGLRGYEDKGLLQPHRTPGGTRRYSRNDLDRVEEITDLLESGVNLAGIVHILQLRAEADRLRALVEHHKGQARGGQA